MSLVLLDASAVLAFLQGEPGEDVVRHALQTQPCAITAANQCEVIAKALDRGITRPALENILAALDTSVIDILAADGAAAGWMRPATRTLGLSLGDRLCLAAAQRLAAPVLTADRPWLALAEPLGVDIRCIRPDAH